jgi:hypothetical protein
MVRLSDSEALRILIDRDAPVLATARDVSRLLREQAIDGAVIGGVAVFLHGHRRLTVDVDVLVSDTSRAAAALLDAGFVFDASQREFRRDAAVVHLVPQSDSGLDRISVEEIDGVRSLPLHDLVAMKLRTGLAKVTRAQDLADVIALIRVRELGSEYARQLPRDLQSEFRRLVKAVESERPGNP